MSQSKVRDNQMRQRIMEFITNNKALFILIILVAIAGTLSPRFLIPRNLVNILKQVSAAMIMGMGYSLSIGSGNMDLSVGYMLGMLGIIAAKLDTTTAIPFGIVIVMVLALGALSGAFSAFFINTFQLPPFIVTLATGQIFNGINYIVSNTSAISGLCKTFTSIGQGSIFGVIPISVTIAVLLTVVITLIVYRTSFGCHILAIGANSEAARAAGLNVKKLRYMVYGLAGICVGIASLALTGRAASAQPQAGQGMEMDAIAAVIIGGTPLGGGRCKPEGTLFGCLTVGMISNILNLMSVNSNWQLVAKGAIILFAVILDAEGEKLLERQRLKAIR